MAGENECMPGTRVLRGFRDVRERAIICFGLSGLVMMSLPMWFGLARSRVTVGMALVARTWSRVPGTNWSRVAPVASPGGRNVDSAEIRRRTARPLRRGGPGCVP